MFLSAEGGDAARFFTGLGSETPCVFQIFVRHRFFMRRVCGNELWIITRALCGLYSFLSPWLSLSLFFSGGPAGAGVFSLCNTFDTF